MKTQPPLVAMTITAAAPSTAGSRKAAYGAGVAAIGEQIAGGNFLDLLKIQKQRHHRVPYSQLARQLGPSGAWRGMWPWGVGMYGSRGLLFGVGHSAAQPRLRRLFPQWSTSATLAAASAAGGFLEGAVTSPLSQMRTRALERMERGGARLPRPTAAALLRPLPLYSLKRALDWGLRGWLYGLSDTPDHPAARAAVVGGASTLITMPIDRVLPLLQQHRKPGAGWWWASVRASGMRSLFAGAAARVAHGAWHTLFVFTAVHALQ